MAVSPTYVRVPTRGALLAARDYPGHGDPIVLLHGGPGAPSNYVTPVADALHARGRRVILFDQRGVGASREWNGRYGVDDYLEDIEAVREHFAIAQWHVFGQSWGGLLAQRYARAAPHRVLSLFLCNSVLGVGVDWARSIVALLTNAVHKLGPTAVVAIGVGLLSFAPGIGDHAMRWAFRRLWPSLFVSPRSAPPVDEAWVAGMRASAFTRAFFAMLMTSSSTLPSPRQPLPFPVAVVSSACDVYGRHAEVVRRRFPTAWSRIAPASAHMPWLEAATWYWETLDVWYRAHANARSSTYT
ncbi:MAG: alpha/beta fold hydrolase [Dehalococcoidia bacterium]|nr:alpha/beta fold hydrolase [Dehalococcoidia bacterium]